MIRNKITESDKYFNLCWVPSHVGIHGNELADRAAREATKNPSITNLALPKSDWRALVKNITRDAWRTSWTEIPEHRNKLRAITDNITLLPNTTCSNRQWERVLARLRLGHSKLTHEYLLDRSPAPTCEYCGEDTPLTIKHLLIECPQHRHRRLRAFNKPVLTLRDVLNHGDTGPTGPLSKFINDINIIHLL